MCRERSARAFRRWPDSSIRTALAVVLGFVVQLAPTAPARAETRPPRPGPDAQPRGEVLHQAAPDLDRSVLDLALAAHAWAGSNDAARRGGVLTVIDYSLPSTQPRLWVFDLERGRLLFRELVAHGVGSGDNLAARFSNRDGTHASSLGVFRTGDTYQGKNGYSLRLHGLEAGTNDQAFARTIVMHGAWYVSREHAERYGRLGRSWGCPAVPVATAKPIIDAIQGGSLLFVYYPQTEWLRTAAYGGESAGAGTGAATAGK